MQLKGGLRQYQYTERQLRNIEDIELLLLKKILAVNCIKIEFDMMKTHMCERCLSLLVVLNCGCRF